MRLREHTCLHRHTCGHPTLIPSGPTVAPSYPISAHKLWVITRHVTLCFLHVQAGSTCCIQDLRNICSFVILPRFHSHDALWACSDQRKVAGSIWPPCPPPFSPSPLPSPLRSFCPFCHFHLFWQVLLPDPKIALGDINHITAGAVKETRVWLDTVTVSVTY